MSYRKTFQIALGTAVCGGLKFETRLLLLFVPSKNDTSSQHLSHKQNLVFDAHEPLVFCENGII